MAGYSGTSLLKKLGIKTGMRMVVYEAPSNYWELIFPIPEEVQVIQRPLTGTMDFVHLFAKEKKVYEKEFVRCRKLLRKDGMLWVSWPKKASKMVTDLDENLIREFGLENGLVDVKVCAVNDIWSGLKFVFRLSDR